MSSIGRVFPGRIGPHRRQALCAVRTRLLACLLMCLPLAAAAAEREPARRALAPQPGVSQDRALNLVRDAVDGRVLSVVPIESGRRGYEVRILLDGGRIQTIRVSPRGRLERR
ncbi:MAG: hypothetical protein OXE83_07400 [Gammaproteobacteria bacterium]|nr:hypothetical protein [Gammaproteobacteria bacterium]